ncbi:hypothetical protein [Methanolobus halotolerans]|uniref:Uncharacterized protein n=1 Tax=Methanolobus halotolerans TaxID=2052935 RepID=A0A4E0PWL8_9EURY|nr:hypothetical protein [Methanolobus halotolerans]TGC08948.1 hypothetical protein CUN85_07905 [Methanolobus halotolerans]
MTLPEVCPRDGVSQCKKADCHLYIIDWRSGDEQCIIGYSSTHKQMSRSSPVVDTYADRTRLKREIKRVQTTTENSSARSFQETSLPEKRHSEISSSETRPEKPVFSEKRTGSETGSPVQDEHEKDRFHEKVVSSDKNTTLIESSATPDDSQPVPRKRKSIDDVMDLDLPDNYEEEFWK